MILKITKIDKSMLIKLEVKPENRINFFNVLQDFLNFSAAVGSFIKFENEIIDSETGETHSITISLQHSQQIETKLRSVGPEFLRFSRKM